MSLFSDVPLAFTFHYVSIKSRQHRTVAVWVAVFTFHYVSIKSLSGDNLTQMVQDLHSTMYLLNPCGWQDHILYQIYIPLCIY